MRLRWGKSGLLMAVGLAVAPALLSSCGDGATNCGGSSNDTFTGRITAIKDDVATFTVASVSGADRIGVVPVAGQLLPVRYSPDGARLLHVGNTYRVEIANAGGEYVSEVNQPCITGTTWPDGSSIRTGSWWTRNHGLLLALSAPVVAVLLFALFEFRDRRGHTWLRREV